MKHIIDDIKAGDFKQVYVLYGPETYLVSQYKDSLLNALNIKEDLMNFSTFSEKNATEDAIIEQCETYPFFADRRVILVEDSGFFSEKKEKMAEYLNDVPSYVILIFIESSVDKRGKLYKAAAKYERVIEFKPLTEDDISLWLVRTLKKNNKSIRKNTLNHLISGVGCDMNFLSTEVEKLICYTGDREEITIYDIDQICSFRTENKIFEMISDITNGRKKEALDKYYDLLTLKEPPMRILYLIARQYDQLLNIKELYASTPDEKHIANIINAHPYAVKKSIPLCRKYSFEDLKKILNECASLEYDVKNGFLTDKMSVELIILNRK